MDVDKKVIAIDIETLALTKDYRELENEGSILNWEKYCDTYKNEDFKRISVSDNIDFYQVIWEKMSALNPIYSKILCLSMGFYYDGEYRSKTLYGDEKKIISDFFKLTQKFFVDGNYKILAGHNIKQFDIPLIYILEGGYNPDVIAECSKEILFELNDIETSNIASLI